MEEILKPKQDYKKLSEKFKETLTSIPDDVLIKYTQQETLEEAGLKHCELIDNFPALENPLFSFKEGAKWQQERMYSEEDMIEASKYGYNFHKTTQFPEQEFEDSCIRNTQQWLTQFKKK